MRSPRIERVVFGTKDPSVPFGTKSARKCSPKAFSRAGSLLCHSNQESRHIAMRAMPSSSAARTGARGGNRASAKTAENLGLAMAFPDARETGGNVTVDSAARPGNGPRRRVKEQSHVGHRQGLGQGPCAHHRAEPAGEEER